MKKTVNIQRNEGPNFTPALPEWQPMSTAPRDGTIIELTWMDNGRPQEIYPMQWGHIQRNGLFAPGVTGMWVMPNGAATWTEHDPDGAPTHWRPLSEAPCAECDCGDDSANCNLPEPPK